jgi:metal-responsive CopG/Arc/MetJ family transcriptional regulator
MNKNNTISDRILTIRIPAPLLEKFKIKCNKEYKKMSESVRECIRRYVENYTD